MNQKQQELIAAVRAHALKHYTQGGWDYVVESWGDAEILAAIGTTTSVKHAIKAVHAEVRQMDDYRTDIQGA